MSPCCLDIDSCFHVDTTKRFDVPSCANFVKHHATMAAEMIGQSEETAALERGRAAKERGAEGEHGIPEDLTNILEMKRNLEAWVQTENGMGL